MNNINIEVTKVFEGKHLEDLKDLTWYFISNDVLIGGGPMGVASMNANDCINSLGDEELDARRVALSKLLHAEQNSSVWKMSTAKKKNIDELEMQIEFLHLATGYVLHRHYLTTLDEIELQAQMDLIRVKNTGITKKQKLKQLSKTLEKIQQMKNQAASK